MTQDIITQAYNYAVSRHEARNQRYGEHPYSYHLGQVADAGFHFRHLLQPTEHIPVEALREIVIAGCWIHDVIEDTGETYNDVVRATSVEVAEIGYALTTPKGRTRKDRHCEAYYKEILETPGAAFVKICDRIANVTFSRQTQSKMLEVYRREAEAFRAKLYRPEYEPMFVELDRLLAP